MIYRDITSPVIFPELRIDLAKVFGERRDEEVWRQQMAHNRPMTRLPVVEHGETMGQFLYSHGLVPEVQIDDGRDADRDKAGLDLDGTGRHLTG